MMLKFVLYTLRNCVEAMYDNFSYQAVRAGVQLLKEKGASAQRLEDYVTDRGFPELIDYIKELM